MYIAVELKVIETTAPAMSRAMGIDLASVVGSLTLLWHRCWSTKSATIEAIEIRGFFAHPEAKEFLVAFGFLEKSGDAFRIRGADRYLRLHQQRVEAGRARSSSAGRSAGKFTSKTPASNQRSTSGQPALTPSTEHRAPSTERKTAPASRSPHPDHQSTVTALMAAFRAANGADYPFGPRDGKAVKEMLAVSGQPEILAAWIKALGSSEWPTVRTLPELGKHLAHFIAKPKGDWRDRVDHSKGFWGEDLPPESEPS